MEQKKENITPEKEVAQPAKNSSKVLLWILGGCLALLIIAGLIAAALGYWGYKKVKNEIKKNQSFVEEQQAQMENLNNQAGEVNQPTESFPEEPPVVAQPQPAVPEEPSQNFPENSERQIGYIQKVFMKGGKNYLNIDYIQWLTGDVAEKAMREDGECPKIGECTVLNDYYIRNVNPLIRTFEVSPDVIITMQTYNMETTGQVEAEIINLSQFEQIWSGSAKPSLKSVPYIIEIQNQQIIKISEQYVP